MKEQDRSLLDAIDEKDVKGVKSALAEGADPNVCDEDGNPTLHQAIARRSKTIIRALLSAGADVAVVDGDGQTTMTLLAQNVRDTKLAAELVAAGADISAPDQASHSGKTPLHYAVKYAKTDFARWLVDQGADLEARDADNGDTPFLSLCRSESGEMSRTETENAAWLLHWGADVQAMNDNGENALHLLGGSGSVAFIADVIKRGVKPTVCKYGTTPLHEAMRTNDRERAKWDLLVRAGNPINGNPRPLLRSAQGYWNPIAVQYLLEQGADVDETDSQGKTALQSARELEQEKIVAILERWQEGRSRAGDDRCPECGAEGLELVEAGEKVPADQLLCGGCGGMFDAETMERVPVTALRTEGKSFLFTGKLSRLTRADAKRRVAELGGVAKSSVTRTLDYLVIGDEGSPLYGAGQKGSKMITAEKLIAEGAALKIISESDFLKLERR